jgi:hypothetical protein
LRPMRCDRLGPLSMYQSPRYPHGPISQRNLALALALKRRFLKHRRRHPPPTRSITPCPKLNSLRQKNANNAESFPCSAGLSSETKASCRLF